MKKGKNTDKVGKVLRKGLSEKELEVISNIELKNNYFFTISDINQLFKNDNERKVYIFRLKNKGRIIKLNKSKYFLIPIKAVKGNWSEHPFILIDEIMNGENYCIVGKASANYWKLIDQIPLVYEVWNTKKHESIIIFHTKINFIKRRKKNLSKSTEKIIHNH